MPPTSHDSHLRPVIAPALVGLVVGLIFGLFGTQIIDAPTLAKAGGILGGAGVAAGAMGLFSIQGLRAALSASRDSTATLHDALDVEKSQHESDVARLTAEHTAALAAVRAEKAESQAECMEKIGRLEGKIEAYETGAVDALLQAYHTALREQGLEVERREKGNYGKSPT